MNFIINFASTEVAEKADLFSSIGIDWKLLALQTVAFLILLWFLGKFVYPALSKSLDKREEAIESASKAAAEMEKEAEEARSKIDKLMKEAKTEASAIVSTAKAEADELVKSSEEKSKAQAEHIVAEARESIEKEVLSAKKALHNETIDLVAQATEKVVSKKLTGAIDRKVIESALEK